MSKFNDLINGKKPVLVDFYATWCGPCKMMSPILNEVKEALGDSASIVKIDVDKNQQAAATYGVRGVPNLILFKEGKIVWRQAGVVQAPDLIAIIKPHLS